MVANTALKQELKEKFELHTVLSFVFNKINRTPEHTGRTKKNLIQK